MMMVFQCCVVLIIQIKIEKVVNDDDIVDMRHNNNNI